MQMEILCKQIDGIKVGSGDYQSLIGKETPDDGYGRHYRQATITPPLFQMCPRRGGGGLCTIPTLAMLVMGDVDWLRVLWLFSCRCLFCANLNMYVKISQNTCLFFMPAHDLLK